MANEDGNEDRLTKNEFAELIQHLSVQEILAIEFRIGTNWSKLFARKNVSTHVFFCNLCVLETSSFKNLLSHMDGKKHKFQMESVKQLYHPDYTYPKNDKREVIEKSPTKKKDSSNAECSTSENVLNTPNQPPVVGDNDKEKSQNFGKNTTRLATCGNVQSKMDSSVKTSTDTGTQNKTAKGDTSTENKEEYENANAGINSCGKGQMNNLEIVAQKQDTKSKENEETSDLKSSSKEQKKITKIVHEKGSLMANNSEVDVNLKKRKIVVNPAAALSAKMSSKKAKEDKSEESNKRPQYQTDKVIIPTVHKNKSHNDKASPLSTLQIQSNDPPIFSVKLYSSNPSDNDIHGILGVEYVIKILKNRNDVSPRYECGLCELVFDGFVMQRHLEGYNHRLKFCEKHFPTAIRQYRQYMHNVPEHEVFKVMAPVLARLATAIEKHHGRNLPYECFERDFSLNRHEILAKAFSCRHASEQYGPTFTHVVGSKEIDEFINNRHTYMPPSFSRTAIFDSKPGSTSSNRQQNSRNTEKESSSQDRHRHAVRENALSDGTAYKSYMSSGLHEDIYPPSTIYKQADNGHAIQHVDDETYNLMVDDFLKGTLKGFSRSGASRENRKRCLSPDRNLSSGKRKLLSPLRENDIWQAYRHMVDHELYNLDERFKQYRKDPETHPSYNEEWQKFWKRRKDELVSAGLDHRKYNYQPEWVRFVKIRIEELYGQEVENVKIRSRERLCLPLTNDNIPDVKYHVQAPKISPSNELIGTVCNTESALTVSSTTSTLVHSSNNSAPQVVSVLRLMTALEDSLGSLGPKIIELLSKALQTEKTNPLHVNAIILNVENCSLIETAKEKFKGLVITGLLEGSKKRVLNQVVSDAEALLQYAYQFKQQLASQRSSVEVSFDRTQNNSSLSFDSNISNALKNQSVGSDSLIRKTQSSSSKTENLLTHVDKKELASKLAASLVAQGKTDFDPQQLQQLIAVYKLIEKKKRESNELFQSNKVSLQESSSSSKKTLSDTLSDLLKSSSTSDISKISNTSHSVPRLSSQTPGDTQFSSIMPGVFGNNVPSNSFASALQTSTDNYFNNAAQSVPNLFGASGGGGNQLEQRNNYGVDYANNLQPNQQNSNMYNYQYQNNNRVPQNWGWNSTMEMNQSYDMGRANNNFNQNSSWQKF